MILRIGHVFSLRGIFVMVALSDLAWGLTNPESSDILAELDLPASGISRAESRIGLPGTLHTCFAR
jgi:hypothetical protein